MNDKAMRDDKLRAPAAQSVIDAEHDVRTVHQDPIAQFQLWFNQARDAGADAGIVEPSAMVLSTVDANGAPSQRNVLLKHIDANGLVFFTNHASRKAMQMQSNQQVSALFSWYALHRQIIIEGKVAPIDAAETEHYFASRPREAQLGAWASRQSEPLASREALQTRLESRKQQFTNTAVPPPPFWGGYRITPNRIEFWQGRQHRLHDRILYTRRDTTWQIQRLYP